MTKIPPQLDIPETLAAGPGPGNTDPRVLERFAKTGAMMPADGLAQIAKHDAIYLGAVGWPGVPDHVSLWGLLIPIRREKLAL